MNWRAILERSTVALHRGRSWLRTVAAAARRPHSIRTRIVVAFGTLIGLSFLTIIVAQFYAMHRADAFQKLQNAIERQTIVLETKHRVESQYRRVRVLELTGTDDSPLSTAERERMTRQLDSIPVPLDRMVNIAPAGAQAAMESLRDRVTQLTDYWKTFYASRGLDAVDASSARINADPLAIELLMEDFPAIEQREKVRLEANRMAVIRADEAATSVTWILFVISILVGTFLAVITSRDLLRAIAALRIGADRIGRGDLTHRIRLQRPDELADVGASFDKMAERLRERTSEMEEQRKVSDSLLLNILPRQVALELRKKGRVEAKYLPDTTIMFADLVNFTQLFEILSVNRMVRLLDELFTDFDRIMRSYRLEKLKTLGDAYMCAGGLSGDRPSHPIDAVMAGFDMIDAVADCAYEERLPLAVRVGIHTGPVAAGVVGIEKFAFDVWGETANFAARLEEGSEKNRINVSRNTYLRVKDFFTCEYRGEIGVKGENPLPMYFVLGLHPELAGSGRPPEGFRDRYRNYFERLPGSYPESLVTA